MADTAEPLLLRFDAFELQEREGRLLRDGAPQPLPPKAFGVLCALLRHPGHLLRKDELLDAVWGHQYVSESVLKTVVRDLRAALGDDARQPRFIETASRRGYRFIAPVRHAGVQPGPALPLPAAVVARPLESTLVGREAALARLGQAWQAALSGRRQMLWVAGEAGIGKTTLLDHFAAGLQGAVVARGQCVEQHGAGEPYLPVLEALAVLCREGPAVVAALRSVAPTWLLQLPWLSDEAERAALRTQLAGAGQERMLREMGELLDRLSAVQPLLLVTEDLHWSDLATLRLLDHLARRRTPARLLWLASFRPLDAGADGHPLKSLRDELRLHGLADELPLAPFSAQEVEDYLQSRLGGAAAPDPGPLSRALHARTEGLPLFVANVVDDVVARSAAAAGGDFGAAVPALLPDSLPVPQSLAGVIGRQAERLATDDRQLLEAASVCGVAFQLETLADALGCAVEAAAERCDALARRHQWLAGLSVARRRDGALSGSALFRHALYRQVFYERIGAVARLQLHQRVAQSLERQAARGDAIAAAELAHHHEQGGETAPALRCYALAADNALRHFAPADALSLTTQALALLPRCEDMAERHELELALLAPRGMASSQLSGVTAPATRAVFERVDALCALQPRHVSGALSLGLGWSLFVGGDYGPALASARRRLAQAEAQDDAVLQVAALHLGGATLAQQGELAQAEDWLRRAIAASAAAGQRLAGAQAVVDLEVSLRSRFSQVLSHQGRVDQAQAQLLLARRRAEALKQPYAQRLVLVFECFLGVRLGHVEAVAQAAAALRRIADEHAMPQAQGDARWFQGWAMAQVGDPQAGLALIREGLALDAALGMWRGRSAVPGHAADALMRLGRLHEAHQELDAGFAIAARLGERIHLPDLHLLRARLAQAEGELRAARDSVQAALHEAARQGAAWLVLAAAVADCELPGAGAQERAVLARARAQVVEGEDETLPQRADALLHAAG